MDRIKILYESMLESGELRDVFPSMTGDWEKDKMRFMNEQLELEELLNETNIDLDDID